jgi:microcystin-dependent protein
MEGTIGEIRIFAGNFAPLNWAFCNGSSMSIANYETLYVLIGTIYGGDGVQTFNLPDLRSRIPVGTGQGPGLPMVNLGQIGGAESVTMNTGQMPSHNHLGTGSIAIPTYGAADTLGSPTGSILAGLTGAYSSSPADTALKADTSAITLAPTGQGNPISIIQPYLSTNYIICLQGIFPSRN